MVKDSGNKDYWQLVWRKFRAGDRDSFEEIYNEFVDALFAYGSKITNDRELVKDCVHDLFMDIYRYSPDLRNPELLEFYLYKSLKRSLIKRLQKDKITQSFSSELTSFDLKFSVENEKLQDETLDNQLAILQKALQTLSDKKRELLFLKFNSGLNYIEIGALLDMKPDTVKKQVYRIIQYLRDNFGTQILEMFFVCYKA